MQEESMAFYNGYQLCKCGRSDASMRFQLPGGPMPPYYDNAAVCRMCLGSILPRQEAVLSPEPQGRWHQRPREEAQPYPSWPNPLGSHSSWPGPPGPQDYYSRSLASYPSWPEPPRPPGPQDRYSRRPASYPFWQEPQDRYSQRPREALSYPYSPEPQRYQDVYNRCGVESRSPEQPPYHGMPLNTAESCVPRPITTPTTDSPYASSYSTTISVGSSDHTPQVVGSPAMASKATSAPTVPTIYFDSYRSTRGSRRRRPISLEVHYEKEEPDENGGYDGNEDHGHDDDIDEEEEEEDPALVFDPDGKIKLLGDEWEVPDEATAYSEAGPMWGNAELVSFFDCIASNGEPDVLAATENVTCDLTMAGGLS